MMVRPLTVAATLSGAACLQPEKDRMVTAAKVTGRKRIIRMLMKPFYRM